VVNFVSKLALNFVTRCGSRTGELPLGEEASNWNSVAAHSQPLTITSGELDKTEHPQDVELVRGLRLGGSLEVLGSSFFPELRV